MKINLKTCINSVIIAGTLATASLASAQTASTTTTTSSTTSSAGLVSNFTPDSIVVRSTTSTTPATYSYTKTTTYVDENGNPVARETVKSGAPVTVYYTQDGDKMVASKVVVSHTTDASGTTVEKQKTTTTTTTPAQ